MNDNQFVEARVTIGNAFSRSTYIHSENGDEPVSDKLGLVISNALDNVFGEDSPGAFDALCTAIVYIHTAQPRQNPIADKLLDAAAKYLRQHDKQNGRTR